MTKITAPTKEPPALTQKLLDMGFDPQFWFQNWVFYSEGLVKIFDQFHWAQQLPAVRKQFVPVCKNCRTAIVDGVFTCLCINHRHCGGSFNIAKGSSKWQGRCKDKRHCAACCDCKICAGCKKLFKALPRGPIRGRSTNIHICGLCLECCKCVPCPTCGKTLPTTSGCACGIQTKEFHHAACCETDGRIQMHGTKVFLMKREPKFFEGTNFQHVRTRRFMSVETEVLKAVEPSSFPSFNRTMRDLRAGVVPEGTVPNGFEINSAPASGDAFAKNMKRITEALALVGSQINVRCGTHVHVDARDFSYVDLINFIHLYNKVEPAIFALLPPWRRVSRFAVPCRVQLMKVAKDEDTFVERVRDPEMAAYYVKLSKQTRYKPSISSRIASSLYDARTLMNPKRVHKDANNQRIRYMALNIHSWIYRRTLEFRHYPGSVDEKELTLWPQVCAAILDAAKRLPITGQRRSSPSIQKLSAHPVEALLSILKPSTRVSGELRGFVEGLIRRWSPDFDVWWPIAQEGGPNEVVPFPTTRSNDEQVLSFDIKQLAYTYIPQRYKAHWDIEWYSPYECEGRYATVADLYAKPATDKLLYMMKELPQPPPLDVAALNAPQFVYRTAAQRLAEAGPTVTIRRPTYAAEWAPAAVTYAPVDDAAVPAPAEEPIRLEPIYQDREEYDPPDDDFDDDFDDV